MFGTKETSGHVIHYDPGQQQQQQQTMRGARWPRCVGIALQIDLPKVVYRRRSIADVVCRALEKNFLPTSKVFWVVHAYNI